MTAKMAVVEFQGRRVETEIHLRYGDVWETGFIFLARTRAGKKVHTVDARVKASEDGIYRPIGSITVLNTAAYLVGWHDSLTADHWARSRHIGG